MRLRKAPRFVLLTLGIAKKVLLADPLGRLADPVFQAAAEGRAIGLAEGWCAGLAFSLQIYFDFSGYSDMAMGLGLLLGLMLPLNFLAPYRATSIRAFWRRWHITLSRFLRDYLYIPMGGNRLGPAGRAGATLATPWVTVVWLKAGATAESAQTNRQVLVFMVRGIKVACRGHGRTAPARWRWGPSGSRKRGGWLWPRRW